VYSESCMHGSEGGVGRRVERYRAWLLPYRKLVSPSPSEPFPEDRFRLYAVCARFPHNLAGQVPWQGRQPGVYDCQWGTDVVRVVVAGEPPQEAHNAPLHHLFSASPELVAFGRGAYRQRSERTSRLLRLLLERYPGEGVVMPYTLEDFDRWYIKEHFPQLTPQERREILERLPLAERREVLQSLPPAERLAGLSPEARLAGLSEEQVRQLLDQLTAGRSAQPRKPRRKK
jgi:hypothetical protein